VELVYNTVCGDLKEALRLAKERLAFERAEGVPSLLTEAMADLAFVLLRTGPEEEISATFREAYDIAVERKLFASARDYAERLAAFLMDSGRPEAEKWMQRARDYHGEAPEVQTSFTLNVCLARIAFLENRLSDAKRILERDFDWEGLRHRRGWLAASIALLIKIQIGQGASVDEIGPNVAELRQLYEDTAMLGSQDCEVAALCAGLLYIGENESADAYLADYLSHKRRDFTQYSRELTEMCQTLRFTPEGRQLVLFSS
jgi:hypothetical protein